MNKLKWLLSGFLLLTTSSLLGSGFGLYEQGVQGQGSVGAYVAQAEDASALFHNPAGLARLASSEFSLTARAVIAKSFYSNPGQSTWDSETSLDALPGFFLNFRFSRMAIALGSVETHYNDLDWDEEDFPARFLGKRAEFRAREHLAGLAFRISDSFSMGASFRFAQIETRQSRVLARPLDTADPSLSYEALERFEADGDDIGFSVGFQYVRPLRFSIGIMYASPIEADLEGDRSFQLINRLEDQRALDAFDRTFRDAGLSSSLELPERLAVGYATRVTVRTRLEVDMSLEKWSSFERTVYDTQDRDGNPEQIVYPRDWDDSFSLRIAGAFQQRKALLWRAGIGTSGGVVPEETAGPDFPDFDRFMYGISVAYTYRKRYILEAAWMFTQNRDLNVTGQELSFDSAAPDYLSSNGQEGVYETQRIGFSLGLRVKFGEKRAR